MPAPDSPFWQFSLRAYGAKGVSPACISLQDDYDIDVNLLLFCAWLGSRGHALDRQQIAAARAHALPWQEDTIKPLRAQRRTLRAATGPDAAANYDKAKAAELDAEKAAQARLYDWAERNLPPGKAGSRAAAEANLKTYLELAGAPSDASQLAPLVEAAGSR